VSLGMAWPSLPRSEAAGGPCDGRRSIGRRRAARGRPGAHVDELRIGIEAAGGRSWHRDTKASRHQGIKRGRRPARVAVGSLIAGAVHAVLVATSCTPIVPRSRRRAACRHRGGRRRVAGHQRPRPVSLGMAWPSLPRSEAAGDELHAVDRARTSTSCALESRRVVDQARTDRPAGTSAAGRGARRVGPCLPLAEHASGRHRSPARCMGSRRRAVCRHRAGRRPVRANRRPGVAQLGEIEGEEREGVRANFSGEGEISPWIRG
jgi:hypothetical protein